MYWTRPHAYHWTGDSCTAILWRKNLASASFFLEWVHCQQSGWCTWPPASTRRPVTLAVNFSMYPMNNSDTIYLVGLCKRSQASSLWHCEGAHVRQLLPWATLHMCASLYLEAVAHVRQPLPGGRCTCAPASTWRPLHMCASLYLEAVAYVRQPLPGGRCTCSPASTWRPLNMCASLYLEAVAHVHVSTLLNRKTLKEWIISGLKNVKSYRTF